MYVCLCVCLPIMMGQLFLTDVYLTGIIGSLQKAMISARKSVSIAYQKVLRPSEGARARRL